MPEPDRTRTSAETLMLNWSVIGNSAAYDDTVYDMLVLLEGKTNTPYVDTVGVPTIGIGFNLRVNLEPVLRAMVGPGNFSWTLHDRLEAQIDRAWSAGNNSGLKAALDAVMAQWHNTRDSDVPTTFRLATDAQIASVVAAIAPRYDAMIDAWLAGIPESEERAALFSLTWNAPSLLGPKLKAAIETGNRAEAWYEIRYNSNGSGSTGIANRRYVEAEDFGLYDDEANVSAAEGLAVGRMVAAHHVKILTYESSHDAESAGALKGMPEIDGLAGELAPAIAALRQRFALSALWPVETLLVASAAFRDISGDGTAADSRANDNDLLIGHAGANRLSGGAAGDILLGLGGSDLLTGGSGGDVFVFNRTSDSAAGAGQDRISDFQPGRDRIDLSAIDANGAAAGHAFTLLAGRGASFSGEAGELRVRFSGADTLIEADIDGDGRADLRILLTGLKDLTASDFSL